MFKQENIQQQFLFSSDGEVTIKNLQRIDDAFMEKMRQEQIANQSGRFNEFAKVGSIPAIFIYKWMKEGFRVENATARELQAKLRSEDLQAFMSTRKSF